MCPVLAQSMRRRGVQKAIGQNCPIAPSGSEAARKSHFMNRWRTGENRPFSGGLAVETQRFHTDREAVVKP